MAYLQGYFDDSGSDDRSPIVTIGGVFAREENWERFNAAWRSALPEDVTEFKAADLEWSGESDNVLSRLSKAEKGELKRTLLDIVFQYGVYGASFSLDIRNFWEARETSLGRQVPYPYFICALACVATMHEVIQGEFPSSLRIVFDQHNNVKGRMENVFDSMQQMPDFAQHYRLYPVRFESSKEVSGLQAADLVAHSVNKHFKPLLKNDPAAIEELKGNMRAQHRQMSPKARPTTQRLNSRMYRFDYATGPSLDLLIRDVEPYLGKVFPELYLDYAHH